MLVAGDSPFEECPHGIPVERTAALAQRHHDRHLAPTASDTYESSAELGSSATTSDGEQARAVANITRWRMSPESWCG